MWSKYTPQNVPRFFIKTRLFTNANTRFGSRIKSAGYLFEWKLSTILLKLESRTTPTISESLTDTFTYSSSIKFILVFRSKMLTFLTFWTFTSIFFETFRFIMFTSKFYTTTFTTNLFHTRNTLLKWESTSFSLSIFWKSSRTSTSLKSTWWNISADGFLSFLFFLIT